MTLPSQPLKDLRVLELGHVVSAPYATQMFADLGAEVVKVEHPEHGDHMRSAGKAARAIFEALNRDKLSVGINLKDERQKQEFLELVHDADIVVENFAPGTMDGLGLGPAKLREENPQLIYVSIKGYSDGPYGDQKATDPIVQARSGLMSVTGHSDSPPARAGTSIVDIATGQYAVIATLLALREHRETGTGEHVTVPMFRTGATLMGYWCAYYQMYEENPKRMGASHPLYAPYNVYPTEEKNIFIGAASNDHWTRINDVLDLSLSGKFHDRKERLANRDQIDEAMAEATVKWNREELSEQLQDAGVPVAPVNKLEDVVDDPHLEANNAFATIDTRDADDVQIPVTIPWLSNDTDCRSPPELGGDTDSVL